MSLLKVENLVVGYGPHPVLHGIDFEVRPGELFAVIGPNAYDPHVLVANYFGVPSRAVTPLDGLSFGVGESPIVSVASVAA